MSVNEMWAKWIFEQEKILEVAVNFADTHVSLTPIGCNAIDG
jgi:hypothetical protein